MISLLNSLSSLVVNQLLLQKIVVLVETNGVMVTINVAIEVTIPQNGEEICIPPTHLMAAILLLDLLPLINLPNAPVKFMTKLDTMLLSVGNVLFNSIKLSIMLKFSYHVLLTSLLTQNTVSLPITHMGFYTQDPWCISHEKVLGGNGASLPITHMGSL